MSADLDRVRQARHWTDLTGNTATDVAAAAARFDGAGMYGITVPQTYAAPWPKLAAAAVGTDNLQLASAIALGFVRSPMETAMTALELDRLSGGRLTLGIGTSVRSWNENRFGVAYDKPLARLRELIPLLRRLINPDEQAGIGRYEGRYWQLDLTNDRLPTSLRPTIPIALAPMRDRMIELSGELADVIFGHPAWTPGWIQTGVRDALDRGLKQSGRQRSDVRVIALVTVIITDDTEQGLADAKAGIPYYASLAQYDSYFEAIGFADDARRLQALAARSAPPNELTAAVSDELAHALVAIGTLDHVAARLASLLDHVDELHVRAPAGAPRERAHQYTEALADLRPQR